MAQAVEPGSDPRAVQRLAAESVERPSIAVARVSGALAAAGIRSARAEAEQLVAYVLGVPRGRLALADALTAAQSARLAGLIERRLRRQPLQHLLGSAPFRHLELAVGPGVFIPRPETELLAGWAVTAAGRAVAGPADRAVAGGGRAVAGPAESGTSGSGVAPARPPGSDVAAGGATGGDEGVPVVVDLCSGSGAIALAVAQEIPTVRVLAVERSAAALPWLRRNAAARAAAGDRPVEVITGDITDPGLLAPLRGQVAVVVCNPPYVPDATAVPPEVAAHDPAEAVFGGPDGLAVIRPVVDLAANLLRPGGEFGVEHDETQGESVPALLRADGRFTQVSAHRDLTGRPRWTTARRLG